jgi:exodeoxyribonuclease-3
MRQVKILCWNVNGIRALRAKGFLSWLSRESPDIICLQETKAHPDQLDEELVQPKGYHAYWNYPQQSKGYSGVATLTKERPLRVQNGFGNDEFDTEGRTIITEYPSFTLFNVYFPNGKKDASRLKYKLDFYDVFLNFVQPLKEKGDKLVICGDFNTAHKEIDLARPKQNENISGFLPVERAWMDKFVAHGFVDTFRHFNKEPHHYTWWDLKSGARARNVGWRIDYFFVTENLLKSVARAFIMPEVLGSDHGCVRVLGGRRILES